MALVDAASERFDQSVRGASEEQKKVQIIAEDVLKKQISCQEDLVKAEPALIAAKIALDTLNKVI